MLITILLIILSLILRLALFNFESGDYLTAHIPWTDFIRNNGYFYALKEPFSNYNPSYLYILVFLTYLPIKVLYSIKLVSVAFDYLLAFFAMLIVKEKYKKNSFPRFIFFTVLFAPTVVLNSAAWAQSDSIYSAGLVAMLFFLIRKKWFWAVVSYSLAIAFKLQAIFFLPLLVIYFFKVRETRKYFLIIPLVYLVLLIPSIIAGRPISDLLTIYWKDQINVSYSVDKLTLNAPNLYQWFPEGLAHLITPAGIVFAFAVTLFFVLQASRNIQSLKKETIIKLSFILALVLPYVLPRMHERYFFMADVISLIYAIYFPKFFYVPFFVIATSTVTYLAYLTGTVFVELTYLSIVLYAVISLVLYDFFRSD